MQNEPVGREPFLECLINLALGRRRLRVQWRQYSGHRHGLCYQAEVAGRGAYYRAPDDFADVAPDLAVEVVSPGDRPRALLDKVGEYMQAGVRLVWVIDPKRGEAASYRSMTDVRRLKPTDSLDGEDVLPGFRCSLAEILK
jgi:Uma2 family endonuclease